MCGGDLMTQMLCLNNVLLLCVFVCVFFVLDTVSWLVSFYFYFCVYFFKNVLLLILSIFVSDLFILMLL